MTKPISDYLEEMDAAVARWREEGLSDAEIIENLTINATLYKHGRAAFAEKADRNYAELVQARAERGLLIGLVQDLHAAFRAAAEDYYHPEVLRKYDERVSELIGEDDDADEE